MIDLPNVKELEKLLKMCRKQGITELEMQGMHFKFGDLPANSDEKLADGLPAVPSDEDMAYWSTQPDPLAMREGAEQ